MLLFDAIDGSTLGALGISATNPPSFIRSVWNVSQNGCGSPFVTSTDGTNNMIVWSVGTGATATSGYMVTTEILVLLFMPVAAPTN